MSSRYRRHARNLILGLGLLTVAAWLVPSFFSAERYRRRLEVGLERALRRPVRFSAVSFRLLPRPGFSIENAVVREDPAFGPEPFARVERIECDLRWRSLWRSRLDFARLRLVRPSLNIVRNARGEWNVESLLRDSGIASPTRPRPGSVDSVSVLVLEANDARLDFKVGADKKPFAITELRARLDFDAARGLLRYELEGSPIRTDRSLPTPGGLELTGEWIPGNNLDGPLDATLRTRNALLYNWVPLVTGRNPEIYGVFDAEVHLTGSLRVIKMEGQTRLSQLHRWELLPPSDPMPSTIHFRGEFDRARGRVLVDSLDASFADSHVHLTGSVEKIPAAPELDLVVALERGRLEDLLALGRRFWGDSGTWGISGRVDGLLAVQGPWTERRYGGFVGARDVRLNTPSGTFPASEVALRIDNAGAHLAPVRLTLGPRVELIAEGALSRSGPSPGRRRKSGPPRYELTLSARAIPLRDLLGLGRAAGVRMAQGLDAEGLGAATLRLAGSAWPLARPTLVGRLELRAARLFLPGLTEPLNLPRARLQMNGDQIVVNPLVAVVGTSVFTGTLQHQGERSKPWKFEVRANNLSVEQGALWFDVLGHRRPLPLLARLPGLSSFSARRVAASQLFSALNAQGHFETPAVTYRSLTLGDFRASLEISGRVIRLNGVSFRAGGGRGQGRAEVDLTKASARVTGDVRLVGAKVQALAPRLPAALQKVGGALSGTGHFDTHGLTREEMSANLKGEATVHLRNLSFGEFDPLLALARHADWGMLEPARGKVAVHSAAATLRVHDRRVVLTNCPLAAEGAKLKLSGTYSFDGTARLDVHADFRRVTRRWQSTTGEGEARSRVADIHLAGPLDRLTPMPVVQVSQASR